ncbi:MAG: TetR/AcrR family transcriptional regulator [Treponema sp.]|jgi:AcrR family transcriptional regulator|nr:TetR/AcrR family transcriptional regulator [Treponema sp.]
MKKEDIIRAAFRVWGRKLYQSISLTHLAKELGVTKPALYRHFPNKQALLDSMYEWFLDDFAAFVRDDYARAASAKDLAEAILIPGRAVARYYCLNLDAFLFALLYVYGSKSGGIMEEELAGRGVDMRRFSGPGADSSVYPSPAQLVILTLMFWICSFHKRIFEPEPGEYLPEEHQPLDVEKALVAMEEKLLYGLGFDKGRVDALDYQELEERTAGLVPGDINDDGLYRAAAGALAEAGPWDVSMEMVARRSGISKSGLYSHFRNRQEMIRKFFLTEFERIAASAGAGMEKSTAPEDRLYLAIIGIADYLRARPEILLALDKIRTRKLELGLPETLRFHLIFEGVNAGDLDASSPAAEAASRWILFLIVNALMRYREGGGGGSEMSGPFCFGEVKNSCFRILYRFIALGIRGFDAGKNGASSETASERL